MKQKQQPKTIQKKKINETKNWYFEKLTKVTNCQISQQGEIIQNTKTDEKRDITTDSEKIQKILRM